MGEVRSIAIALLSLALAVVPLASAETLTGRVVGVADGDTVTVLDGSRTQHKIRVNGIDAPEKAQPFGQRSKQSLSALVYRKDVAVQWAKRDRYGRIVGKVIAPDGADAGLEQIRAGLAWWYRKYANEQSAGDRRAYEQAEADARAAGRGLWSEKDPVPPWEWRHRAR